VKPVDQHGRPLWVIGSPISHTLSPPIHNEAFQSADLPHRYFAMEVESDELKEFLDSFRGIGGLGANLTLPLKQRIRELVSRESDAVEATGAANTLYWSEASLALDNTDVYGFKELVAPLKDKIQSQGIVLLGAGGAARACLQGLAEMACPRVILWNRTTEKAVRLKERFDQLEITVCSEKDLREWNVTATVVVNATSLGLDPEDPSPFPESSITGGMVGVDLIYGRETQFMSDFRKYGSDATDGLTMLVAQAARSWERWIGREPDRAAMNEAVRSQVRS